MHKFWSCVPRVNINEPLASADIPHLGNAKPDHPPGNLERPLTIPFA